MDKTLIEKYKKEMLNMYKKAEYKPREEYVAVVSEDEDSVAPQNEPSGNLIAVVTALRSIYPVSSAQITVFTGDYNDMQVVARGVTDQSGRSQVFTLPTPEKSISLDAENIQRPYALYNLLVKAEGYLDNIHLNIPVFSGVTSLQRSNLVLIETAGANKGPQIFDEAQQYQL